MEKNIMVGQSGGPTSAINATLYGILKEAFFQDNKVKVYGGKNGIEGIINNNILELDFFRNNTEHLELLKNTPSAYLGSCRYKLPEEDEEIYAKIFDCFNTYNIGYFFYIGGNDSMDTVAKLQNYSKNRGYDIKILGLPKTIDNDLFITDHTPGYGSAAKYIATTIKEIMLDTGVYGKPSIMITEIMGRHAGWLTAAASLAVEDEKDRDSLLIYLPEVKFSFDKFLDDVNNKLKKTNNVIIAVSEGLKFEDGTFVCEMLGDSERDAFGHTGLSGCSNILENKITANIKVKVRSTELNILQRCAAHSLSLTDINESSSLGQEAVKAAIKGETGKMLCLGRENSSDYKVSIFTTDVKEVCNKEKKIPLEWITKDSFVTKDFYDYASPLIQGEVNLKYKNGLPVYIKY